LSRNIDNMKKNIILFLFITTFLYQSKSQSITDSICYKSAVFLEHARDFFSAPLHYGKDEYSDLFKSASLTGLSFFADKKIKSFIRDGRHRTGFMDKVSKIDRYYGNTKSAVYIIGGTFFTSLIANDKDILEAGILLAESVIFSNIITQSIKILSGRERPDKTDNNFHFIGPSLGFDQFHALPSGHATTSFAISTVAAGLTDNKYLKVLFYAPAFLTSFSRIYNNRHWFSDVMLGSLIGYYTGRKVLSLNGKIKETEIINIHVGYNSIGLTINF